MWFELLIFGGWIFWLFIALATVLFLACAEHDNKSSATIGAAVLFFVVWFFFGDLWALVAADPWQCLYWPAAWLGIGTLWSLPRWMILLHRARTEYKESHRIWLEANDHKENWFESYRFRDLANRYGLDVITINKTPPEYKLVSPTFEHNRERLVNWILLWPWSMMWTLIRDGFYRLLDNFSKVYQRISVWMFRGLDGL